MLLGRPTGVPREHAGLLGLALAPAMPEDQVDAEHGTQSHAPDEHVWYIW